MHEGRLETHRPQEGLFSSDFPILLLVLSFLGDNMPSRIVCQANSIFYTEGFVKWLK